MNKFYGSPYFYEVLNDIRSHAASDFVSVRKIIHQTAKRNDCSDYDAAVEVITTYMVMLRDALQNSRQMTRITAICRVMAETAIWAILCYKSETALYDYILPEIHEWLNAIEELHSRKNHDYSLMSEHPLSAFMVCAVAWNKSVTLPQIAFTSLMEKKERLKTLRHKLHCAEETILDTLQDLAVYAILTGALAELEQEGWDREAMCKSAWAYLD